LSGAGLETSRPLPLRWLAPEVLVSRKFTVHSDCYSYGMLLVELYTGADLPLSELEDAEVISLLTRFYRRTTQEAGPQPVVEAPPACPRQEAQALLRCVDANPDIRPSFEELVDWMSPSAVRLELLAEASAPRQAWASMDLDLEEEESRL
jgi:hypothetical protein